MSGIYIPGMEMPKSCDKCIYSAWSNFYQIYVCNAVRKNEPVLFDGKQTKSTAVARSARADNCPLIPVPDHGRLIDADALEDLVIALKRDAIHAYEWTGKSGEWNTRVFERERFAVMIEDAPTIIPADHIGEANEMVTDKEEQK